MISLLIFVAAYFGSIVMALARAPIWGLYAYLLAFYVHPPSRWWGASIPDLRWSLVAAAVTVLATFIHRSDAVRDRPSWLSSPLTILFIAYVAIMWIQTPWAADPETHRVGLEFMTKYIVVIWLMYRLCDTEEKLKFVLLAHVAGCFYLGWIAFGSDVSGRLDGVGGPGINNANSLGMQLGTGLVTAAMLILVYRGWERWVAILMAPFIVNAIILTQTRGAFLGVLAAGLVIMFLRPRVNTKLFYSFGALGVVLFLWLAQDVFWERMGSVTAAVERTEDIDSSAESRIYIIQAQWQMALDYPLGTGFRGTAALSPRYIEARWLTSETGHVEEDGARSSHNTFMTTLVEQGFLGSALYLALWFCIARAVLRIRFQRNVSLEVATFNTAIGAALTVVFVAGMFTDYLNAEVQYWYLALLLSLVQIAEAQRRQVLKPASEPVPSVAAEPGAVTPTKWYPG
jgi:hypothetical protein